MSPIKVRDVKGVVVFRFSGQINVGTVLVLREELDKILAQEKLKIIFNLADNRGSDIYGRMELASAHVKIKNLGGTLFLVRVPKRLRDHLRKEQPQQNFYFYEDEEEAAEAIRRVF